MSPGKDDAVIANPNVILNGDIQRLIPRRITYAMVYLSLERKS